MWIVWLLLYLFGATAPSAFVVSPSDQINGTLAVVNGTLVVVNGTSAVVDANSLPVANVSAVVNNSLVVVDASSLPVANVSTVVNGTSAVIEAHYLAVPDAFSAVTDASLTVTNALTATLVPTCALIVKLVNSSRHEFQIVPVECPAPGDYWLAAPQKVHFQSANLIEVTQVKML